MRHFGLDVTLATTMIGANPGYFHEGFYMENMEEDQCRVTQLFKVGHPCRHPIDCTHLIDCRLPVGGHVKGMFISYTHQAMSV